jgi:hypothetical protein
MSMAKQRRVLAAVLLLGALVGCGDDERDGTDKKAAGPALAEPAKLHDWDSVALRNALVTVQVVPRLGGRVMSYAFHTRELLYANPRRYGQIPGAEPVSREPVPSKGGAAVSTADVQPAQASEPELSPFAAGYANFGGQVTWPTPQVGWPPSVVLDQQEHKATIDLDKGDEVRVTLTSPADEALGAQLTRTLSLPRAATALRVSAKLTNRAKEPRPLGLQDLSQHPGALAAGETFSADQQLYLPLGPTSPLTDGWANLLGSRASAHWKVERGVLRLSYGGQEALAGADGFAGWAAYADARHDTVLAKVASQPADGKYPDRNLTATAYAAPSARESYVAMALRSPLATVAPGQAAELEVWYGAARCPLPVVGATKVGVVNTPLVAEQTKETVAVKGVFGVFYQGWAQLVWRDKAGAELARGEPTKVTPLQPYRLDTVLSPPAAAVQVALEVLSRDRVPVGVLAQAPVTDRTAAKAETPKP